MDKQTITIGERPTFKLAGEYVELLKSDADRHYSACQLFRIPTYCLTRATKDRPQQYVRMPVGALPDIAALCGEDALDAELRGILSEQQKREARVRELTEAFFRQDKPSRTKHEGVLMRHQQLALDIAAVMPKYGFFYDVGTGKTLIGLSIVQANPQEKWLIVTPKPLITLAWQEDQERFHPDVRALYLHSDRAMSDYRAAALRHGFDVPSKLGGDRLLKELCLQYSVVVTNPEMLKNRAFVQNAGFTGIIIDESSMLKAHSTMISRLLVKMCGAARRVYLLSGKPAPNGEHEYFMQMRCVEPALFGDTYTRFKNRYFFTPPNQPHKVLLANDVRPKFAARLRRRSLFISKHDCLDLPPETEVVKGITLTRETMALYRSMEKEAVLELQSGGCVAAPMAVQKLGKLRQITSGFILESSVPQCTVQQYMVGRKPKAVRLTHQLHTEKLDALLEQLDELGAAKAIIWVNFQEEARGIAEALRRRGSTYAEAHGLTADTTAEVRRFQSDEAQYLIANPKSIKYGVTLTGDGMNRNCTCSILYSPPLSGEDLYQLKARIHRKGQTEPVLHIWLICEGTVDVAMRNLSRGKVRASDLVEQLVRGNAVEEEKEVDW